jgi:hypothetical protein
MSQKTTRKSTLGSMSSRIKEKEVKSSVLKTEDRENNEQKPPKNKSCHSQKERRFTVILKDEELYYIEKKSEEYGLTKSGLFHFVLSRFMVDNPLNLNDTKNR